MSKPILLRIPYEEKDDAKVAARAAGGWLEFKGKEIGWLFHGQVLPLSLARYSVDDVLPEDWMVPSVDTWVRLGGLDVAQCDRGYRLSLAGVLQRAQADAWVLKLRVAGPDRRFKAGEVSYTPAETAILRSALAAALALLGDTAAAEGRTPLVVPFARGEVVIGPRGRRVLELVFASGTEALATGEGRAHPVELIPAQVQALSGLVERLCATGLLA